MKKFLAILTFIGITTASAAQEESEPTERFSVSTNSFGSNWFVSIQGTYSNYMDGGAGNSLLSTPVWGSAVALGKWFTPGLGIRVKLNGWQTKNMNFATEGHHSKYLFLTADIMLNLTNLLKGYNEKRIWNIIPYISGGTGRNCTANHYTPVFGAGMLSTWKLCRKADINLECSYKAMANDFGGASLAGISPRSSDRIFAIEAGITYRLGNNTWKKASDMDTINNMTQMEIDALNAQIADLEAENERLRNQNNETGNNPDNNQ